MEITPRSARFPRLSTGGFVWGHGTRAMKKTIRGHSPGLPALMELITCASWWALMEKRGWSVDRPVSQELDGLWWFICEGTSQSKVEDDLGGTPIYWKPQNHEAASLQFFLGPGNLVIFQKSYELQTWPPHGRSTFPKRYFNQPFQPPHHPSRWNPTVAAASALAPKTAGSSSVLMDSGTDLKNVVPMLLSQT